MVSQRFELAEINITQNFQVYLPGLLKYGVVPCIGLIHGQVKS